MSTATATTVTVQIDPTANSQQADIIGPANATTAGVLPAWLYRLILSLVPVVGGSQAFFYTVQLGDGGDFIVPIPLAAQQTDGNYVVSMTLSSLGQAYANPVIPLADQTATQFRVVLDGEYDPGTILGFIIKHA